MKSNLFNRPPWRERGSLTVFNSELLVLVWLVLQSGFTVEVSGRRFKMKLTNLHYERERECGHFNNSFCRYALFFHPSRTQRLNFILAHTHNSYNEMKKRWFRIFWFFRRIVNSPKRTSLLIYLTTILDIVPNFPKRTSLLVYLTVILDIVSNFRH